MPLERLHALAEKLRLRIHSHRSTLSGSEWLTRYTLIDPLLRELGWDTEDPELVIPEYSSGGGRADYALLNNGRPAVIIEAKKLGEPLSLSVISQVLNYCLIEGTAHFAMTDGRRWEIYETHKPVPISEKRIVSFDLLDTPPSDMCLKALALWRQNIASGQVGTAQTPIVTPTADAPDVVQQPEPSVTTPPTQSASTSTPSAAIVDTNEGWLPLTEVREDRQRGVKSIEICFPDASRVTKRYWYEVVGEVALWLINMGHLRANHCPIKPQSGNLYILHTEPYHSDGKPFKRSIRIGPLFLNPNYGMGQHIRNVQTIIRRAGQDPSQFKARW
ncbi:MAG: hypothetical protein F4Y44_04280 [Chloroflexi bacterium]|nr:hypothetical protein [Chloroflexota bacterium]